MPAGQNLEIKYQGRWLNISYYYEERGEETLFFIHGLGSCKDSFGGIWKAQGYLTTPYLPLIYPVLVTLQDLPVFPMV